MSWNRRPRAREEDDAPTQPTPGTITAIELQKRDDTRVNISIDGLFAFGLHLDLQLEHRLKVGQFLDEPTIEMLLRQDQTKKAIAAALNLISFRSRSSGELRDKLRQKGYPPDAIDGAITRMQELRYLDDESFAERWVESRQAHRPRSERLLRRELQQKGIDAETIASTIDDAGIDEFGDALDLARKKLGSGELDEAERRRLTGFLGRRGYGYDVIRRVLDALGDPDAFDDI